MAEEFFSDLRAIRRRKQSTVRGDQNTLMPRLPRLLAGL
jgi:hypothetical protein